MASAVGLAMQISANTAGVSKGLSDAEKAVRALGRGADSAAKDFDKYRDASGSLPAALQQVATDAGFLASEFRRGLKTIDEFAAGVADIEAEAKRLSGAFSEGASTTAKYASEEEKTAAAVARLAELLQLGAINAETYGRAFADVTGATAAAAAAAESLAETLKRGASVTSEFATDQEKAASKLAELQKLLDAGAINAETYSRAVAEASGANKAAAAAADALEKATKRAAQVTEEYATAEEKTAAAIEELKGLYQAGLISVETYGRGVAAASGAEDEAKKAAEALAATMKRGAEITKEYANAEEQTASTLAELKTLLEAGAIGAETYARGVADADGSTKAAKDSLDAWNKKQAEADAITKANLSAQEKYDQTIQNLQGHLEAGRISQETFNAAQAKAQADLTKAGSGAESAAKSIEKIEKSSDKAAGSLRILAVIEIGKAVIAGAQAVVGAVQGIISKVGEATQKYDALADTAARTGVSVEALAGFSIAGQLAGVEDVTGAIEKLGVEIGQASDPKKAKAFEDIGLSLAELNTLSPEEQFRKVQQAIAALPTAAEKAAAAVAIFGQSGAGLVPLFDSSFSAIEERAKKLGIVLTEQQVGAIDEMYDALTLVQATFDGIIAQVGANLAPIVTGIAEEFLSFVENFEGFDGSSGGTGIADVITNALFDGAEFLAGVFDSAVQSLNEWADYFGGWVKIFQGISNALDMIGKSFFAGFKIFEIAGNLLAAALGAFLEGLGSWVSSDLEQAGKMLKDSAAAAAKENIRQVNAMAQGGATGAARGPGAAESFVERQRAQYESGRGPEGAAKRAAAEQEKLQERLAGAFASAERQAKNVFESAVPDSIKEGISAAGEETRRVLELARADGKITEEEAKKVAEAQLKYNQAIDAGKQAMEQAEKDAKKRAELEEKYAEKALEIDTERLEGLRTPANKKNEGADIRSSEGVAEYIRLATGRQDPAVEEYRKQLAELQKIRKEINKAGTGKASIAV